jgi:hypothetical protein
MAATGVPTPHHLGRPALFPLYPIKHELGLLSISHRSSSPPPRLHSAAPKLHRPVAPRRRSAPPVPLPPFRVPR